MITGVKGVNCDVQVVGTLTKIWRRHIEPVCGSRNRGIVAVAEDMAEGKGLFYITRVWRNGQLRAGKLLDVLLFLFFFFFFFFFFPFSD